MFHSGTLLLKRVQLHAFRQSVKLPLAFFASVQSSKLTRGQFAERLEETGRQIGQKEMEDIELENEGFDMLNTWDGVVTHLEKRDKFDQMEDERKSDWDIQQEHFNAYTNARMRHYRRKLAKYKERPPSSSLGRRQTPQNELFPRLSQLTTSLPCSEHDSLSRQNEGQFVHMKKSDFLELVPEAKAYHFIREHEEAEDMTLMVRQGPKEIIRLLNHHFFPEKREAIERERAALFAEGEEEVSVREPSLLKRILSTEAAGPANEHLTAGDGFMCSENESPVHDGYLPHEAPKRSAMAGRSELKEWYESGVRYPFLNSRREWPRSLLKVFQDGHLMWGEKVKPLKPEQAEKLSRRFKGQYHTFSRDMVDVRGPLREWDARPFDASQPLQPLLIDGERGTGKTAALLHTVMYGRQAGFLVLFIPDSFDTAVRGARITPSEEYAQSYNAHHTAQPILEFFYQAHKDKLSELPIQREETRKHCESYKIKFNRRAENYMNDFNREMPDDGNEFRPQFASSRMKKHTSASLETLADLVALGASDLSCSSLVLTDLIYELRILEEVPVMIAIDGVNYLNLPETGYRVMADFPAEEFMEKFNPDHVTTNFQNLDLERIITKSMRGVAPYEINYVGALLSGVSRDPVWNRANTLKRGVIVGATDKKHPQAKQVPYDPATLPLVVQMNNFTQFEFFSWVHHLRFLKSQRALVPSSIPLNSLYRFRSLTDSNGGRMSKEILQNLWNEELCTLEDEMAFKDDKLLPISVIRRQHVLLDEDKEDEGQAAEGAEQGETLLEDITYLYNEQMKKERNMRRMYEETQKEKRVLRREQSEPKKED